VPLGERLLLALSRDPATGDFPDPSAERTVDNATRALRASFPNFLQLVVGKDVVDFGCGSGYQAVAMALQGARFVLGIDPSATTLGRARALAEAHGVSDRVQFVERAAADHRGRFDVVISQNSMEHFPDPAAALALMASTLRNGGTLLITFSPPWYAPYGSHTRFFTRVPWVNLLFSERTVMAVRSRFRSDGATRYEDVEGGLNRMSLAKFERLVRGSALDVVHLHYQGVRGLRWPVHLPLVRELLVTRVDCALRLPADAPAQR